MILAASFIAAGTSSQDNTPRPQLAQVMATAFHVTPSATPRPTFTPIPTPAPLRITRVDPSNQEILDFLFQYPYWGAYIIPSRSKLSVERLDIDSLAPALIITGDGAEATDGFQVCPAAFGAVLSWDNEGYARKFLRVQFGHRDAQVSVSISPDGRIVFTFRDIGNSIYELSHDVISKVREKFQEFPAQDRKRDSAIRWFSRQTPKFVPYLSFVGHT